MEKGDGFGKAFVLWGQNKENRDTKAPKTKSYIGQFTMLLRSPHEEAILSAHLKLAEPGQVLFLVPQYLPLFPMCSFPLLSVVYQQLSVN